MTEAGVRFVVGPGGSYLLYDIWPETLRVVHPIRTFLALSLMTGVMASLARADGSGDPAPISSDEGKYVDHDGNPTFNIDKNGKVDFYSYIGFVRYSANCLQCHGPDGLGSTYAPSLVKSLQKLGYGEVLATVAGGKRDVSASQNLVMPALGENKNVMCYIDAIYVYLRGRSDGAIGRGRPPDHEPRPASFEKTEDSCMG